MAGIEWLAALTIGSLFGWAWGYSRAERRYRAGWLAGYEDCRQKGLTLARNHDLVSIEMMLERDSKTESNCR